MATFIKIGKSSFNIDYWKDKTKAEFVKAYKDQRLHKFDSDAMWNLLQKEFPKEVKK